MVVALILFLGMAFAVWLTCVVVFKDKQLVSKKELKELRSEYSVMDDALRQAFLNPDQAQLYISNAFSQISSIKNSQTKEID